MLRIIFEERFLVLQIFFRRLHFSGRIRYSGNECVLTGSGSGPDVREQLPRILAISSGIQRRRLTWSLVDADFDGLDRSAVVQHNTEHFVPVVVSDDARTELLKLPV